MSNQTSFQIVIDEFNSQIFCLKMGNIILNAKQITEEELEQIRSQKIYEHLSVKINTDNKRLLNQFLKEGFYLVDTQITFRLDDFSKNRIPSNFVRKVTANDLRKVMNISKKSFRIDRFHNDENLNFALANEYYMTWTKNLIKNESILTYVYEEDQKIYGFCSWQIQNNIASLILVAVLEGYRGRGVYKAMINHFLYYHCGEIKSATTGTQINNYPVHKFWGKAGAYLFESKYVLHKKI